MLSLCQIYSTTLQHQHYENLTVTSPLYFFLKCIDNYAFYQETTHSEKHLVLFCLEIFPEMRQSSILDSKLSRQDSLFKCSCQKQLTHFPEPLHTVATGRRYWCSMSYSSWRIQTQSLRSRFLYRTCSRSPGLQAERCIDPGERLSFIINKQFTFLLFRAATTLMYVFFEL